MSFDKLKELNLSRDEVERIGDALKKPEFRQLLSDYVEEIQNPENKAIYESEIVQLEKDRGNDVSFLHPKPGYVIKTTGNGTTKIFINICTDPQVGQPTSVPTYKNQTKGLQWSLPHSIVPAREDLDTKGKRCQVYDVVFHPDTLMLATKAKTFREMVDKTTLDALEKSFNVELDRNNLKYPKMGYKGIMHSSLIRKASDQNTAIQRDPEEKELYDKIYADIDAHRTPIFNKSKPDKIRHDTAYTAPKYVIKHRSHVDLQECLDNHDAKFNVAIPNELVIEINLPLIRSASDVVLDVDEKCLQLYSEKPAKYKLSLTLPYRVDEEKGSAKFDSDKRVLTIVLPVIRSQYSDLREDSGVESDATPSPPVVIARLIEDLQISDAFLDKNLHYNLPEFTAHLVDSTLCLTLNVKNVEENAVDKRILPDSIHLKFSNISASFYPIYYAFYLKLNNNALNDQKVQVEVWDNNVILQIRLEEPINRFLYGIDGDDLQERPIDRETSQPIVEDSDTDSDADDVAVQGDVKNKRDGIDINVKRTSPIRYESSGDELSCSFSPSKCKGILKRYGKSLVERSISESSLDDICISSSFDGEMTGSLKKTVRFNNVITRQVYRSNSSILGQKKKNQRRAKNKKRAMERRHSESETSEMDDKIEDRKNGNSDVFVMDLN